MGMLTAGFTGLRSLMEAGVVEETSDAITAYGSLIADPKGMLDLPSGFSYQVVSRVGETMHDGFLVPAAHDGMAAFAGPDGRTILIRNHEVSGAYNEGPFGENAQLRSRLDKSLIYDPTAMGGTTTLIYDTRRKKLDRHFLSLAGTMRNCAGGPTPWNSWVTCEETLDRGHGYAFEVPASASGPVQPVPLKAMGRFNHEAIAVDRASGVVYETEDRGDGLLYRFIPRQPGNLAAGGKLQALQIQGLEGTDTANHGSRIITPRRILRVQWVDLENEESGSDDLRAQGRSKGAARFSRGEGIWAENGVVYFICTDGGPQKNGQIWRYTPSAAEGTAQETSKPGTLELYAESVDSRKFRNVDNVTGTPWGDMLACEDNKAENHLTGITPKGETYQFARNAMNDSEFAGATFSPDGTTLFVNIQRPGMTLAITGPWRNPATSNK